MRVPGWVQGLDEDLFLALNGGLHDLPGTAVPTVLRFANEMGSALVAVPILATMAVATESRARRWLRAAEVLLAVALVFGLSAAAKAAVERPRPPEVLAEAFAHGDVRGAFEVPAYRGSLPSGHAATATALAIVLAGWSRGLAARGARRAVAVALVLGVALVGLARVYAGNHFPLDVAAGVVVGAVAGLLARHAVPAGARALARPSPPPP